MIWHNFRLMLLRVTAASVASLGATRPTIKKIRCAPAVCALLAVAFQLPAQAATREVSTAAEFHTAILASGPGDEIVLSPGRYAGRFEFIGKQDLRVRSLDPANPGIIDAAGVGEGIKMSRVTGIELRDLVVENAAFNGINIDDVAGGIIQTSSDIRLLGLTLRKGGGNAIKMAGVDNFLIDRAQIVGWAPSDTAIDLVGAHNGLIQRSYLENTNPGSGTGIQTKGGSANVVIRANRLVNANERAIQIGGETGLQFFRPQPPGTVEARGIVAEGNVILHNGNQGQGIRAAVSFINTEDGLFRNNVVYRPSLYAVRILRENWQPGFIDTQKGVFKENLFVWNGFDLDDAVNVGPGTLPKTFVFSGNRFYNAAFPSQSKLPLPTVDATATYGVNPNLDLRGITPWDFAWGSWVVNTSDLTDTIPLTDPASLRLAVPSSGADFDVGAAGPFRGEWHFQRLAAASITVLPFDYALLAKQGPSTRVEVPANSRYTFDGLIASAAVIGGPASRLALSPDGTAAGMAVLSELTIAPDSALDLNDNDLVLNYTGDSPLASIRQQIVDGLGDFPNTAKIVSSHARSLVPPGEFPLTVHAPFDNALEGATDWLGVPLTGTNQIIAKYTYFGDLNLDGVVDAADYLVIDNNFGQATQGGPFKGDANFSGTVDAADYLVVDNAFGRGAGGGLQAGPVNGVPEPSTIVLSLLCLLGLWRLTKRNAAAAGLPSGVG